MDKVLYKIKSFDKLILRYMLNDKENDVDKELCRSITPSQMRIIDYVLNHENTYQKDLEEALNLRRATVSGVLQTMEKNGLLERTSQVDDARVKKIILNERTKKIFEQTTKKFDILQEAIIKDISSKDLEKFDLVMDKMTNNLIEFMKDVKK